MSQRQRKRVWATEPMKLAATTNRSSTAHVHLERKVVENKQRVEERNAYDTKGYKDKRQIRQVLVENQLLEQQLDLTADIYDEIALRAVAKAAEVRRSRTRDVERVRAYGEAVFEVLESDDPRIDDDDIELGRGIVELETRLITQSDLPPGLKLTDPKTGYLRKFNSDPEVAHAILDLADMAAENNNEPRIPIPDKFKPKPRAPDRYKDFTKAGHRNMQRKKFKQRMAAFQRGMRTGRMMETKWEGDFRPLAPSTGGGYGAEESRDSVGRGESKLDELRIAFRRGSDDEREEEEEEEEEDEEDEEDDDDDETDQEDQFEESTADNHDSMVGIETEEVDLPLRGSKRVAEIEESKVGLTLRERICW